MMGLIETVVIPASIPPPRFPEADGQEPGFLFFPDEWPERTLACSDSLFREGDPKTHIIRLEAGILSLTSPRAGGPPEIVELVFPGSLLGLGFLKHHIHNASAVVESRVSLLPLEALPALCEQSPAALERHALATEREFVYRRRQIEASTANTPHLRLAAFLSAVSRLNQMEGRNPRVIEERPRSGEVADFLRMDLETLMGALTELKRRELVDHDSAGKLLLLDPEKLENLNCYA